MLHVYVLKTLIKVKANLLVLSALYLLQGCTQTPMRVSSRLLQVRALSLPASLQEVPFVGHVLALRNQR